METERPSTPKSFEEWQKQGQRATTQSNESQDPSDLQEELQHFYPIFLPPLRQDGFEPLPKERQKASEYRLTLETPLETDLKKQGITIEQYPWLTRYLGMVEEAEYCEQYPAYELNKVKWVHYREHCRAKRKAYENLIQKIIQVHQFKQAIAEAEAHQEDDTNAERAEHIAQDKQLIAEAEAEVKAEEKRLDRWSEV